MNKSISKNQQINTPYNLNSISEILMGGAKIINWKENEGLDLYILVQKNGHFDVDIFKTMNQTFNSPDFNWCCEKESILEALMWIEDDEKLSTQILES